MRKRRCGVRGLFLDIMLKSKGHSGGRRISSCFLGAVFIIVAALCTAVAGAETQEATFRPWSGHWWPYSQGGLGTGLDYRGRPAPLEKYNLLTTGVTTGPALTWYLAERYDPDAPDWYGLCGQWAKAAATENIDILPSSENNIIFRVGDKKGLLTLAHDSDMVVRANGSYPDEFHLWLLTYIKDQKKAFVADLDPGPEVWSYPVYRYDMQSSRAGGIESVRVQIYFADDFVHPDYRGTQVLAKTYTYDLFLDGSGAITGGQWTGPSVTEHPDMLNFSVGTGLVTGLDYSEIVRIARSRDDFLEDGSRPVSIGPGTYNLILMDEDVYRIDSAPGNVVSIRIAKESGSLQAMAVSVLDGTGLQLYSTAVSENSPMDILLTTAAPPYTLRLTQGDYTDPNIYVLLVDIKRSWNQDVSYIPKTQGEWSGFALTNPGSAAVENVTLATQDAQGNPLQTVLGPLRLGPGEKRVFIFDDLPVRRHELAATKRLSLTADGPVDLLNLIGNGDRSLIGFVQGVARGGRLVIPDTARELTPGVRMFGGIRNESFEAAEVTMRLYSAAGVLLQQEALVPIAARGWLDIAPGLYPFYSRMPSSGWIDIQSNGAQTLSGFQYLANASGVESLFALPVGSARKIVPHITEPGFWKTSVTLINPNDAGNAIRLHPVRAGTDGSWDLSIFLGPHEKRVLEIQDHFGKPLGNPLHSIVEITGGLPLVGYYSYSTLNGKETASYPLLDDSHFKGTLSLPHYAGSDGYWWTGAAVCNASAAAQAVILEPYDRNGNLMAGSVQSVSLEAGAYDVFDVAARFGAAAPDIGFIRFRTAGDAGVIGGFYLYGNTGLNLLSGANMQ